MCRSMAFLPVSNRLRGNLFVSGPTVAYNKLALLIKRDGRSVGHHAT